MPVENPCVSEAVTILGRVVKTAGLSFVLSFLLAGASATIDEDNVMIVGVIGMLVSCVVLAVCGYVYIWS